MIFLWGRVILWMGLIFYLSGIPNLNSGLGLLDLILRKLAHMIEYAILAGFLLKALQKTWPGLSLKQVAAGAVGVSFFYAISDEIHQSFVLGRSGSPLDVAVDSIGIVLCAYLWAKSGGHFRLKKL